MKSDTKLAIEWRRNKVLELYSQGNNQTEISRRLHISIATINRDIFHIRRESQEGIKNYLNERLPEEYAKVLVGLDIHVGHTCVCGTNQNEGQTKGQVQEEQGQGEQGKRGDSSSATLTTADDIEVEEVDREVF